MKTIVFADDTIKASIYLQIPNKCLKEGFIDPESIKDQLDGYSTITIQDYLNGVSDGWQCATRAEAVGLLLAYVFTQIGGET
jgi:hypothetical protein